MRTAGVTLPGCNPASLYIGNSLFGGYLKGGSSPSIIKQEAPLSLILNHARGSALNGAFDYLDWVALNPQPLPPDPPTDDAVKSIHDHVISQASLYKPSDVLTRVALNPQPLPPEPPPLRLKLLSKALF